MNLNNTYFTLQVTFSADGRKVLAVDVDGNRYKLDALPQDPELLNTLTTHKVSEMRLCCTPHAAPEATRHPLA